MMVCLYPHVGNFASEEEKPVKASEEENPVKTQQFWAQWGQACGKILLKTKRSWRNWGQNYEECRKCCIRRGKRLRKKPKDFWCSRAKKTWKNRGKFESEREAPVKNQGFLVQRGEKRRKFCARKGQTL